MTKLTDLAAQAADAGPTKKPCQTCVAGEEIVEAIETVANLVADGKSRASMSWLHRRLEEDFNYKLSCAALRNHLVRCCSDLYSRSFGRG